MNGDEGTYNAVQHKQKWIFRRPSVAGKSMIYTIHMLVFTRLVIKSN